MWDDDDGRDSKRTLGIRDKQILYEKAKGRCENPACNKKITFIEMQPGHKIAWSKGGKTLIKNSVCLCYKCNKLQGNDNWVVFLKKQGCEDPKIKDKQTMKRCLEALPIKQIKLLASKHHIKVNGSVVEDWLETYNKPPTKKQYITKLSGIVTAKDLSSITKETPKTTAKKKSKKKVDDS